MFEFSSQRRESADTARSMSLMIDTGFDYGAVAVAVAVLALSLGRDCQVKVVAFDRMQ